MTDLPSNVAVCGVKGTFAYARLVAGDADGVMDLVPVVGLVVTLTASPTYLLNGTATPKPLVIVPEPLALVTDAAGDLRDVDGNSTAYVIASDDVDLNPHDWTYTVSFSGPGSDRFRAYSAAMPGGTTVDISLITPIPSALGISVSVAQAAEAAAAAYATAAAASATAAAASAAAVLPTAVRNPLTGFFHLSGQVGVDPTGVSDSTAGVQAAYAAAGALAGGLFNSKTGAGATVLVDGQYRLMAPTEYPSAVRTLGLGQDISRLVNNATDLFAWTTGHLVFRATFEHVSLETGSSGGSVFNVYGDATAGLVRSRFSHVTLRSRNTASSLMKWRHPSGGSNSAQFIGNVFDHCDLDAPGPATVPAFDMLATTGNNINSNIWENSWCEGHNTSAVPFFRIECSNGGYNYNNTFRDLIGEQNGGGFIHLYACDGVIIENCPDWDLATAYSDHVYKFAQGTGQASFCRNVRIENSYRLSSGGLGAGVYDIYALGNNPSTGTSACVEIINCTPPGNALVANLNGSAYAKRMTQHYKVITGSYTIVDTDPDLIICNSASGITVTLPAATSAKNGRRVTVKNAGAGAVTIGATVDGVASPTLAQWAKATYLTDGANAALGRIWMTV